jgi:hypothetical protein
MIISQMGRELEARRILSLSCHIECVSSYLHQMKVDHIQRPNWIHYVCSFSRHVTYLAGCKSRMHSHCQWGGEPSFVLCNPTKSMFHRMFSEAHLIEKLLEAGNLGGREYLEGRPNTPITWQRYQVYVASKVRFSTLRGSRRTRGGVALVVTRPPPLGEPHAATRAESAHRGADTRIHGTQSSGVTVIAHDSSTDIMRQSMQRRKVRRATELSFLTQRQWCARTSEDLEAKLPRYLIGIRYTETIEGCEISKTYCLSYNNRWQ